jgi:hypothetical protein
MSIRRRVSAADLAIPAEAPVAELRQQGQYKIYEVSDGSAVVTYQPDGQDQEHEHKVPAPVWRVITAALSGQMADVNPMTLLKMMLHG